MGNVSGKPKPKHLLVETDDKGMKNDDYQANLPSQFIPNPNPVQQFQFPNSQNQQMMENQKWDPNCQFANFNCRIRLD